MSDSEKKKIIDSIFEESDTVAQRYRKCEMLGLPFEWPSINEQIVGKGSKKLVKRGRAKYGREMYVIPGFEVPGHAPFAGFNCHPSAALSAATELIRLYKLDHEKAEDK